jgi:decaprenylphospho-beta-D-ribofuranose 2-oxidase
MEGYTLAIDFPNRASARELIRALELRAAEAGGRLYFAKDALAEGAKLRTMYPELGAWQEQVAAADPDAVYETDLVRRLGLRTA